MMSKIQGVWYHRLFKLCPSLLTLKKPAPEQSIYWNVKHSLEASVSIKNHQNAVEVWVTQASCTNTQSAVRKSNKMRNKSKIKILYACESKFCDKESELVSFSRERLQTSDPKLFKNTLSPLCYEWLKRDLGFFLIHWTLRRNKTRQSNCRLKPFLC